MTVSAVLTFAADHKYSFENLGIFYNITSSSDLTVEVTYGKQYGEYFGVVDIPQTTSYNGVYYTVTSVGKHAFSACSGLTKVIFPETVTKIGDYAFSGCNAMMEMVIPTTITSIGNYAFNSCSRLSNIEFVYDSTPLSLGSGSSKGASYGLFYDCPLESITITRPLSYSTLKSNGYSPFAYHPTLKSAVFKNWINTGNYIFCGCDALTSVTLPDFMVTINDYSFYGCKSLKSIDIPDKVTSLGNSAFRNCRFTTFTLGSGVESIGDYCFAECLFPGLQAVRDSTLLMTLPQRLESVNCRKCRDPFPTARRIYAKTVAKRVFLGYTVSILMNYWRSYGTVIYRAYQRYQGP